MIIGDDPSCAEIHAGIDPLTERLELKVDRLEQALPHVRARKAVSEPLARREVPDEVIVEQGAPSCNALPKQCIRITIVPLSRLAGPAMPALVAAESTLTDRYQTTVPEAVRRALDLNKRDRIRYEIRPNGDVVLSRAVPEEAGDDPVLDDFLSFLARDLAAHPERLKALDEDFVRRLRSLTDGVDVDLDAPLSPGDE
ncbi:MAG: type II toxin-antitoxin system PrlF family antitoxin [Burkholderiales bacterium]